MSVVAIQHVLIHCISLLLLSFENLLIEYLDCSQCAQWCVGYMDYVICNMCEYPHTVWVVTQSTQLKLRLQITNYTNCCYIRLHFIILLSGVLSTNNFSWNDSHTQFHDPMANLINFHCVARALEVVCDRAFNFMYLYLYTCTQWCINFQL